MKKGLAGFGGALDGSPVALKIDPREDKTGAKLSPEEERKDAAISYSKRLGKALLHDVPDEAGDPAEEQIATQFLELVQDDQETEWKSLLLQHPKLLQYRLQEGTLLELLIQALNENNSIELGLLQGILAHKPDLDFLTGSKCSHVTLAISQSKLKIAELLLKHGADVDFIHPDVRNTALYVSAKEQSPAAVDLCLRFGAQVNMGGNYHYSPLYKAVQGLQTDDPANLLYQKLLQAGADIEQGSLHGRTALMAACSRGLLQVSQDLLQRGANPEACEHSGHTKGTTVLDYARTSKNERLVSMIEQSIKQKLAHMAVKTPGP